MHQTEWTIGTHRLHFEEPDLVVGDLNGEVGMEDAKEIVRVLSELGQSRRFFFFADVSRSTITGDARRHVGENMSEVWLKALIYYGAGPIQRAMGKAIMLAMYFSGKVGIDAHLFATRAEAMAHVEKTRMKEARSDVASATSRS